MYTTLPKHPTYLLPVLLALCCGRVWAGPGMPVGSGKQSPHTLKTTPADFWAEQFALSNGTLSGTGATPWTTQYTGPGQASQRFAVFSNEFRINNITVNGTGTWTSGSINIAGKTNVAIAIDVRSGVTGNGSLDDDNSEHYDYLSLYYKIDGGAEQLFWEKRGAINNNSSINTTITKDSLSGSMLQIIVRARATATDEFYFFDNVAVSGTDQVTIDADATVSGILTCTDTTVLLSGTSSVAGVSYSWTGPNGFTAGDQQTAVNVPGLYTLTVTGAGGAVTTDTVTVMQDIVLPINLTAFANDRLTCFIPVVTIRGNSGTPGVTYSWAGPGGFTASTAITTVTVSGLYALTVTNPVNGCFRTIPLTVMENKTPPADVTATVSGILTCTETLVTITGSSSTPNAGYNWIGPEDFASSSSEEWVSAPGNYILTVMNQQNGCVASATVTVQQDLSECQSRKAKTASPKRKQ
ncbi:hypothetical protein HB364_09785 [Pseudoflavitalea sp. X16]|uniref:hypothetical protein n=1 Tax=Paraflavitalea devenefica TaxID=2716334 RepID=UPI001422FD30|nr:hypothetical protein [Paraflavitalea devenefica]NII25372.1 hypothetical protein [Paraflavitalea devenefica]